MSEVTKDDLRDSRDTILNEMRLGFSGVHQRQDITNGRVGKLEIAGARYEEQIKTLFQQVRRLSLFRRHTHARRNDDSAEPEDRKPITRRDVWVAVVSVSSAVAVIKGLAWLSPLLKPGP